MKSLSDKNHKHISMQARRSQRFLFQWIKNKFRSKLLFIFVLCSNNKKVERNHKFVWSSPKDYKWWKKRSLALFMINLMNAAQIFPLFFWWRYCGARVKSYSHEIYSKARVYRSNIINAMLIKLYFPSIMFMGKRTTRKTITFHIISRH